MINLILQNPSEFQKPMVLGPFETIMITDSEVLDENSKPILVFVKSKGYWFLMDSRVTLRFTSIKVVGANND